MVLRTANFLSSYMSGYIDIQSGSSGSSRPRIPKLPHNLGLSSHVVVSPAPLTKARMRWTQELHEVFLDSLNKLGGIERATPKGVLKVMDVEGLTISRVKCHMQV